MIGLQCVRRLRPRSYLKHDSLSAIGAAHRSVKSGSRVQPPDFACTSQDTIEWHDTKIHTALRVPRLGARTAPHAPLGQRLGVVIASILVANRQTSLCIERAQYQQLQAKTKEDISSYVRSPATLPASSLLLLNLGVVPLICFPNIRLVPPCS